MDEQSLEISYDELKDIVLKYGFVIDVCKFCYCIINQLIF
jgi:hypothetical protein